MSERTEKLRDEIRSILNRVECDPDALADDIVAAVTGVLEETGTVEWSLRRDDGRVLYPMPEAEARAAVVHGITGLRGGLTLVRRRVGSWEVPS